MKLPKHSHACRPAGAKIYTMLAGPNAKPASTGSQSSTALRGRRGNRPTVKFGGLRISAVVGRQNAAYKSVEGQWRRGRARAVRRDNQQRRSGPAIRRRSSRRHRYAAADVPALQARARNISSPSCGGRMPAYYGGAVPQNRLLLAGIRVVRALYIKDNMSTRFICHDVARRPPSEDDDHRRCAI